MKAWRLGYEKAKKKAKELYIAIGRISSDALGGDIVAFTSVGFNHLIRKGRNPRTRTDQKKRFSLIPHIKRMIQNPRAVIEYRKTTEFVEINRHGKDVRIESVAEFWTFVETIDDCIVKVVIRQVGTGGPKHFFSVMGDNIVATKGGRKRNKKSRR